MAKNKKAQALANWEAATEILALYREARCAADRRRAAMEDALRKVQESYQGEIDAAEGEAAAYALDLRRFADAHKREFVAKEDGGEGRTRTAHGVEMGWRWGKPFVHIPKKFEAEAVAGLEAISEDTYVKRPPKIMRDVLKAELLACQEKGDDRDAKAFIATMAALHIALDQEEEFVLEVVKTT